MVPVSLVVSLARYAGILQAIGRVAGGAFRILGLPGEAAVPFVTSAFLNIYSAIAAMGSLALSPKELTTMAVMCLVAHNLIVETAVLKRAGSSAFAVVALRIGGALAVAFVLRYAVPDAPAAGASLGAAAAPETIPALLASWARTTGVLVAKVLAIVTGLMLVQRLLSHFGITRWLARAAAPLMRLFGLPGSTAFSWIVANTLGLAYGSAILIEETKSGRLAEADARLLNYHIAVSHSLLEDTLLFVAIGVSALWIMVPRLLLAMVAVWGARGGRFLLARTRAAPDRFPDR
jgi:spore maturation protein SpmB